MTTELEKSFLTNNFKGCLQKKSSIKPKKGGKKRRKKKVGGKCEFSDPNFRTSVNVVKTK